MARSVHSDRLWAAFLVPCLMAACSRAPAPRGVPSPSIVDGNAILDEVRHFVGTGPRAAGTPGASKAAAYISSRLHGQGYRPALDAFSEDTPDGDTVFANVIGIPPHLSGNTLTNALANATRPVVILLSHYDTKSGISENFVGANDSGSSTGLLLYLAGLLAKSSPPAPAVILAFVDGEECRRTYGPRDGLHGSRHLANQILAAGLQDKVYGVMVLDMIGDKNLKIRIPQNTTGDLLRRVLKAAKTEGVRSTFGLSEGTVLDDHVPFLTRGIDAIDLIDFEYGSAPGLNDYWHTNADTLDKLSAESLETMGRVVLRTLEQMRL